MLQMAPKDGSGPMYSPHRDVAYIYRSIIGHAFTGLEQANWEEWYGSYLKHHKTTEADLGEGAKCLADAINYFTGEEKALNTVEALTKAGFYKLPYPVQITIFARLGMVLTGTMFSGIRDVTQMGEEPPAEVGKREIVAEGIKVAARLRKTPLKRFLYGTWRTLTGLLSRSSGSGAH